MQSNRSDTSGAPGDEKSIEFTYRNERDIQDLIDSLHRTICDLLMKNEMLRRQLAAREVHESEDSF